MNNIIGERLKNFRMQKGLTQQKLELAIGASFGHISKVESGQINPTKETLLKIVEVLKLTEEEAVFLLGLNLDKVSKEEIQEVIKNTKEYLENSKYPSYLQDDYFFVHSWNKKMLDLLGVNSLLATLFRGKNSLEMMLQPQFKKIMSKERWEKLFQDDLVFFMKSVNYPLFKHNKVLKEILNILDKYPEFKEHWNKALARYSETIVCGENLIYFNRENKEVCYYMSVINLVRYPRFRIVEYIPIS